VLYTVTWEMKILMLATFTLVADSPTLA